MVNSNNLKTNKRHVSITLRDTSVTRQPQYNVLCTCGHNGNVQSISGGQEVVMTTSTTAVGTTTDDILCPCLVNQ